MRARPARVTIVLWVLLGLFVLAGIVSLGAYLALSRRGAAGEQSGPITGWAPAEAVRPDLALLVLVGWPEQAVIDRALVEGEPDTALAALAYSTTLSDRERGGSLLRVAGAYADGEHPGIARALYMKVGMVAFYSPDLADVTRAELLMQAANGLTALRESDALRLLAEAEMVVRTSRELQPAQRQQLAVELAEAYQRAGVTKDARELGAKPARGTERGGVAHAAIPLGALVASQFDATLPADVQQAQANRRQAASALIEVLQARAGPPKPSLVADLGNALWAEDKAMAALSTCSECAPLAKAEAAVRWGCLKRQVAHGQFGVSLLPPWEAEVEQIDADLAAAWAALLAARRESAQKTLPAGASEAGLEIELLRGEMLAGTLGLLPQYDLEAGFGRLVTARQALGDQDQEWTLLPSREGAEVVTKRFLVYYTDRKVKPADFASETM